MAANALLAMAAAKIAGEQQSGVFYGFEVSVEERVRKVMGDIGKHNLSMREQAETRDAQPCPNCGRLCRVRSKSVRRKTLTKGGRDHCTEALPLLFLVQGHLVSTRCWAWGA